MAVRKRAAASRSCPARSSSIEADAAVCSTRAAFCCVVESTSRMAAASWRIWSAWEEDWLLMSPTMAATRPMACTISPMEPPAWAT
jgi:hypothetical protein